MVDYVRRFAALSEMRPAFNSQTGKKLSRSPSTLRLSLKTDSAQDERRSFDIVKDFPFMLRVSKHSELLQ